MRSKEERRKKCKGQESTIGKIIYGFLLFLPLFAIGVTCGYVVFNKNAYQSYASETINKTDYEHILVSDLDVNKNYYLIMPTNLEYTRKSDSTEMVVSDVYLNGVYRDVDRLRFYVPTGNTILYVQGIGNNGFTLTSNNTNEIIFKYYGINNSSYVSDIESILYEKVYVNSSYLSEVFYYSIDKVQQSPLFNWAQNSIIYTTLTTTCTALSITTPFIPLLLSYWLIISVIYFLYDIALMLVWIVHRKVHELQESI